MFDRDFIQRSGLEFVEASGVEISGSSLAGDPPGKTAISSTAWKTSRSLKNVSLSMNDPFRKRLLNIVSKRRQSDGQRQERQARVYQHLLQNSSRISSGNFATLAPADLGMIFHAVDEEFFDGCLATVCEKSTAKPLQFRLSTRMTSSGGMTTMQNWGRWRAKSEFEIAVATTPLFETFKIDNTAIVGGLVCRDRLEALQRIMEHEIVHLIELMLWKDSNCSANPFREIVHRFFGHLESNHQLLTPRDVARKKLGISIGDKVRFRKGQRTIEGYVNRISKRATVLVHSQHGQKYSDGQTYEKFYVPLTVLKKA